MNRILAGSGDYGTVSAGMLRDHHYKRTKYGEMYTISAMAFIDSFIPSHVYE